MPRESTTSASAPTQNSHQAIDPADLAAVQADREAGLAVVAPAVLPEGLEAARGADREDPAGLEAARGAAGWGAEQPTRHGPIKRSVSIMRSWVRW
jgi:hypothetical protein